jgi:hypothetical protein
MYMDDDANFDTKLDDIVQPTDRFLVGKEPYDLDDRCFTPDFPLSNASMARRFGIRGATPELVGPAPDGGNRFSSMSELGLKGVRSYDAVDGSPEDRPLVLWDNKFFFNWALFSSPGNPLLLRIMTHIVQLLKAEYLGESKIKLSPVDHRGKLLMCATTFPITHAARELVLENDPQVLRLVGLRVGGVYFKGEG